MGFIMPHRGPPEEAVNELYMPEGDQSTPTVADLEQTENIMITIASHFDNLMHKTGILKGQDLMALASNETLDPDHAKVFRKPRVHLAQSMIEGFWDNKLPLVNDLLCTKFPATLTSKVSNLSKDYEADVDQEWPPPLPVINDRDLAVQVYMHRSFFKLHAHVYDYEVQTRNNERLEFKGDSVLDRVICDMLYTRFPSDSEGQLTRKKSSLVNNHKLWELARLYKMEDLLISHISEEDLGKLTQTRSKILADTFEAYIGGVAVDRGFAVARNWLVQLYRPFVEELDKQSTKDRKDDAKTDKRFEKAENDEVLRAKSDLYQKIGSAQRRITYTATNAGPPFKVNCIIEGEVIGTATGPSIKQAGNAAALDALSKPDVIERHAAIRRRMPRLAPRTMIGSP